MKRKSFKEFCFESEITDCEWYSLQIEEVTLNILLDPNDLGSSTPMLLKEANHRGKSLGGAYSYVKHPPHIPDGQYHLHIYKKQNQIFALNFDGTAHDQSHGIRIPNKVADAIQRLFPNVKLPTGNLIETDEKLSVHLKLNFLAE